MIRYHEIQGRPAVFRSLTGMDPKAFEALFAEFDAARRAARAAPAAATGRAAAPPAGAAPMRWRPATAC
jgi:hypothetical protein